MFSYCQQPLKNNEQPPLILKEQGSFAVGGKVITNLGTFDPYHPTPAGQTFHGDHAYVFYQIPAQDRKFPLVFLHGAGQFSRTWETTPDGREGFQNIFLRRGFGVFLIDQPRRGNAGRSVVAATITPTPDEQAWFGTFRIGIWPDYFAGVQFAKDPETLNQFGLSLAWQGEFGPAAEAFRRAYALDPSSEMYRQNLEEALRASR